MAGGRFQSQNKVLPGVYINFESAPATLARIGDRGTVAIAQEMNWGAVGDIITINDVSEVYSKLGYDLNTADEMLWLRQIYKGTADTEGANKVYVWRLGSTGGAEATTTIGNLTVTAASQGTRGNEIYIIVAPDLSTAYEETPEGSDDPVTKYAVYSVETVIDGSSRDKQIIGTFYDDTNYVPATIADLANNAFVTFSGTGELEATAGIALTGGLNPTVTTVAHSDFLAALEKYLSNIIIYDGTNQTIKSAYVNFAIRMTEQYGRHCQTVVQGYPTANHECAISVDDQISVLLNTDEVLDAGGLCWWIGGAEAGCPLGSDLTYREHPDAVELRGGRSLNELESSIAEGTITLIEEYGIKILVDINTFTGYTPTKGEIFSYNQTIRTAWSLANDIYETFSRYYIGKQNNTEDGRELLHQEVSAYCNILQGIGAIQNFDGANDVIVHPGEQQGGVVIELFLQFANSMKKIYMYVTCS